MIELDEINQTVDGKVVSLPWIRPYQLISWWNMEQFAAAHFYVLGSTLERLRGVARAEDVLKDQRMDSPERSAHNLQEIMSIALDALDIVEIACNGIGLRQPLKQSSRLRESLKSQSLKHAQIVNAITELHDRIKDEMEDHLFMHIPADRAALYYQPELFGTEVGLKFPSIQFDVVEAGNCYAAGRGTAVVFHLMRIMETGVQAFGTKLGVKLTDEKNWQVILDEINKAIKALPKSPQTVEMSQASANLYAVKLAWRNEVMHPKDTYTLEEADNLIRQVRIFMGQLATIV